MRNLLEIGLLGLAAMVCVLSFYWAWQEFAQRRGARQERRRGRSARPFSAE